jgi:hypothetical protein
MTDKMLTDEEQKFLASLINASGDGQHPVATPENLDFFADDYKRKLVRRVKPSKLNERGRAALTSLKQKLSA